MDPKFSVFWQLQKTSTGAKFSSNYLKSTTRQYLIRFSCCFNLKTQFNVMFWYNLKSCCINLVLSYALFSNGVVWCGAFIRTRQETVSPVGWIFRIFVIGFNHCLIITCRGTYKQQPLSNSRTRKVDQKVLQEQCLCTFGRWCMHLIYFSENKNTKHFFLYC